MSAPLVWVIFPGIFAVLMLFLQRWSRLSILLGAAVSLGLAVLASNVPIGELIRLGPFSIELSDTFSVLGRRLILVNGDRPVLMIIYLGVAFWYGGALFARVHRSFAVLTMGITALLTAALAVEPFLYAALLFEIAALASVPLLAAPGRPLSRGVIRFLSFMTIGFPFILFTGWLLAGGEGSQVDPDYILHSIILLGFGFVFLLGIFPFHTWMTMLSEEAHPYAAAYVFFIMPLALMLFILILLNRYTWLGSYEGMNVLFRWVGVMMVFVGGFGSAFQRHLGRILGYAAITEVGFSLLAIGLGLTGDEYRIFFTLLLPRGLSYAVWSLSLVTIANGMSKAKIGEEVTSDDLRFRNVQGAARKYPFATIALLLAHFSLAGLPLLAGFPVRLTLLETLFVQSSGAAVLVLLGLAGLTTAGLRTLAVLVMGPDDQAWQTGENLGERLLLFGGGAALIVVGLLPQWFTPTMVKIAQTFLHAGQ